MRSPLIILVALFFGSVGHATTQEAYANAEKLNASERHDEALVAFIEAARAAEEEGRQSYRFSAYYGASFSAHRLVKNDEAIRYAEKALAVAEQNRSASWAMRRQNRLNEIELVGLIERSCYTQARIGEGQRHHRRAVARYRDLFLLPAGDQPLSADEVKSMPPDARSLGWRLIEREADYLHDTGQTTVARAMLRLAIESANADLVPAPVERNVSFYAYKLLRTLASIEGFIGYEQNAFDLSAREWELSKSWKKPAELHAIRIGYLANLTDLNGADDEVIKEADQVLEQATAAKVRNLAAIRRVHAGIAARKLTPAQRATQLGEAVKESKATGDGHEHFFSSRDLLFEHAAQNQPGLDERFHEFLNQTRSQGNLRAEPRIYRRYGDWLVLQGRYADAVRVYRQALQLTLRYEWHPMVPGIYAQLGAAYLLDGQDAQAHAAWDSIERYVMSHPDIPATAIVRARETQLYALIKAGRRDEALAFARVWRRYGTERNVAAYWLVPFDAATISAASPRPLVPTVVAGKQIRLNPTAITTVAVTGESAEAVFYLLNPDSKAAKGLITLTGPGARAIDESKEHLGFALSDGASPSSVAVPLTLDGGDFITIRLRMKPAEKPEAAGFSQIQISWSDAGERRVAVSAWRYSWDEAALNASVLEAAEGDLNPFIGMPVQHSVHVPEHEARPVPFRVRASSPLRIEYVDIRTGGLLAVDNNGNGDLTDAGDICNQAKAGGLAPSPLLRPGEGSSTAEIEVWCFPTAETRKDGEITLGVELYDGNAWNRHAVDRLKL